MTAVVYAWFAVIVLCLGMYVLLDGYDLGIGVLLLFERTPAHRRELVELVATAWDGNETWLILFAVSTWAGLPVAYGVMLPAVYLPLIVMLFALVVRGASIELISAADGVPRGWGLGFSVASLVAALAQGCAIGGVLSGVTVRGDVYAGGSFDFFTPFSVVTGLATVVTYTTAAAAYLRFKTAGDLQRRANMTGRALLGVTGVLALVAALSLPATATPIHLHSAGRVVLCTVLVAGATAGVLYAWRGFGAGADRRALTGVIATEVCGLLALITIVAPGIVPPTVTIRSAGASGLTELFLLIGVGLNIPLVLFYSWFAHHVFRGKYRTPPAERPVGRSAAGHAIAAPPGAPT